MAQGWDGLGASWLVVSDVHAGMLPYWHPSAVHRGDMGRVQLASPEHGMWAGICGGSTAGAVPLAVVAVLLVPQCAEILAALAFKVSDRCVVC
jgi:hypothetical protein